MREEVQRKILENAKLLLSTAEALAAADRKLHAAHFAAICQEECAKCLMYFENVEKVFDAKAKRSHVSKGQLVGIFYYLAGKLTATFNIRHLGEELKFDPGLFGKLNEILLQTSGVNGPKSLEALVGEYFASLDEYPKVDRSDWINDVRKNSVYCDVVDGKALSPGERVSEDQLSRVISTAKLAVGLLDMAMNEEFSWETFIEIFPKELGNPQEEAAEWLAELKRVLPHGG